MSNLNFDKTETKATIDDTAPRSVAPGPLPDESTPVRKRRRWLWVLAGVFVLLLMTASGGYAGYRTALNERLEKESANIAMVALTQFQLGLDDLAAGRYQAARDRFEYVIELDPSFPGAAEKLSEALLAMAMVTTPTPRPTPTIEITPTPDLRGAEELYDTAVQHLRNKEWDQAIETLDRLRQEDLTYRTLDVDGMYYIALRYRGVQKIIFEGNLEGGMYDLSLTEIFGPLDHEANGYRNWARMYVSGASFWEIDWERVLSFFSQIYPALPNLRDGSNMTAVERFRRASIAYGDQLMEAEEACLAVDQYNNALSITEDPEVRSKMDAAINACSPPEPTARPVENTPTPSQTEMTPTPGDATEEPTPEPTPIPTETVSGGGEG
jgi:tetratricopeptide (TPR) repeat protein